MVYTVVRDAFDIEKHLMGVCPEWHKASEYSPYCFFFSPLVALSVMFLHCDVQNIDLAPRCCVVVIVMTHHVTTEMPVFLI